MKKIVKKSLALFLSFLMIITALPIVAMPLASAATITLNNNGHGVIVSGSNDRYSNGDMNIVNDGQPASTSAGVLRFAIGGLDADAVTNVKLSVKCNSISDNSDESLAVNFWYTTNADSIRTYVDNNTHKNTGWGSGRNIVSTYLNKLGVDPVEGFLGSNPRSSTTRKDIDITWQFKSAIKSGSDYFYVVLMLNKQDNSTGASPWTDAHYIANEQYITYDTVTPASNYNIPASLSASTAYKAAETFSAPAYFGDSGSNVNVATGGYSNVIYCSRTTNFPSDWCDKFYTYSKVASPNCVVLAYDGVHETSLPLVLEIYPNGKHSQQVWYCVVADESRSAFDLAGYWQGIKHEGEWYEWPGDRITFSGNISNIVSDDESNKLLTMFEDSGSYSSGTKCYFWNKLVYNGDAFNSYYDNINNVDKYKIKGSYKNVFWYNEDHTIHIDTVTPVYHVINYKPIYDIFNGGATVTNYNTGRTYTFAGLFNEVWGNERHYTVQSLNEYYAAVAELTSLNVNGYFNGVTDANAAAKSQEAADAINSAYVHYTYAAANLSAPVHDLEPVAAVAPDCVNTGIIAHYNCTVCSKKFSDAAGTNELATVADPAMGHDFTNGSYVHIAGEEKHAKQCARTGCDAVDTANKVACTVGTKTYCTDEIKCPVCTYVYSASATHDFTNATITGTYGSDKHTVKCNNCTYTKNVNCSFEATEIAPTCTEQGYTTHTCACGNSYTDTYVDEKGHSYGEPSWEWTGYTSATATFSCTRPGCTDEQTVTATKAAGTVTDNGAEATCTEDATKIYTAKVVFNGTEYSAVNEEFLEHTGHSFTVQDTSDAYRAAAATCLAAATYYYKCANCTEKDTEHTFTVGEVSDHVWINTENFPCSAATCTENATYYKECSVCNESSENITGATWEKADTMTGHDFTGDFVSGNNGNHSRKCVNAGCTETGIGTDAGVSVRCTNWVFENTNASTHTKKCADCNYSATENHTYGAPASWEWSGYASAKAVFVCQAAGCGNENRVNAFISDDNKAATCTEGAVKTYTASVTVNGTAYSDTKTETLDPTGHIWSETEKYLKDAPTCTTDAVYWKECSVCGISSENEPTPLTWEKADSKLTHTYGQPAWEWEGYTKATATFTCSNGCGDTHSVVATGSAITDDGKEASCSAEVVKTYKAKVTFNGTEYSDEKTEKLSVKAHTYGAPVWTWTGYTAAQAEFTCTAEGCGHTETETAVITDDGVEATCKNDVTKTYTATVAFNGTEYTDTATQLLTAIVHTPSEALTYNGNETHSSVCSVCDSVLTTVGCTWDNGVEITAHTQSADGTVKYTCTACGGTKEVNETKHAWGDVEVISGATCLADGIESAICTVCGLHQGDITVPALGHLYGDVDYTWDDELNCTATKVCGREGCTAATAGHTVTETVAGVPTEKIPATCYTKGTNTYTAEFTTAGFETKTKDVQDIELVAHTYTSWTKIEGEDKHIGECSVCPDDAQGHTTTVACSGGEAATCIAKSVCTVCGAEYGDLGAHDLTYVPEVPFTCLTPGHIAYWHCEVCGNNFSDEDAATQLESILGAHINGIPTAENNVDSTCHTLGSYDMVTRCTVCNEVLNSEHIEYTEYAPHTYGAAEWTWNGYTGATAVFSCTNAGCTHSVTETAVITDDGVEATCKGDVTKTYTATVEFNGASYADEVTETLTAIAHTYGAPVWSWTGLTGAQAVFTCTVEGCGHSETKTAVITDDGVEATCKGDVTKTYTATVEFNGASYADEATETLTAIAHTYGAPVWSWTGFTGAQAVFTCTVEGCGHSETETAVITDDGTVAICKNDVTKTYTAAVEFGGATYTDEVAETLTAKPHTPVIVAGVDATCTTAGLTEGSKCSVCETVLTAQTVTGALGHNYVVVSSTDATCVTPGSKYSECSRCDSTKTETTNALGHSYGAWELISFPTETDDGIERRKCSRCDAAEERPVVFTGDVEYRSIRFIASNNMHYNIMLSSDNVYTAYNSATAKWPVNRSLTFTVRTYSNFGFSDYIVYFNGVEATPNEDGSYTVPAGTEYVTVTVAGAAKDSSSASGKLSFWELLLRFFRRIISFFKGEKIN